MSEDEAWNELEESFTIRERNQASMAAWESTGLFLVQNADRLGRMTIREIFEQGFIAGYKRRGEIDANPKR